MNKFYELMGNIDQLTDVGQTFEWDPRPQRARQMLLLAENIVSGLQTYLHPFDSAGKAAEGGDAL